MCIITLSLNGYDAQRILKILLIAKLNFFILQRNKQVQKINSWPNILVQLKREDNM